MEPPTDESLASYDAIPYPSRPIRHSHPCRLATLPHLFGLEPTHPGKARVLELGCAAGGNLLPMAQDLPESEFFGVDLSARQIEAGQTRLARLARLAGASLNNVTLEHRSIADVTDGLGVLDYIICHGVYSWVPREIQDRILEIGRRQLSPHGVLYVSYNTQPGWRLRGAVREMMQFHTNAFKDPREKIAQARSLLKFLAESAESVGEAYPTLLREEAKLLDKQSDAYLFHEHLEADNEPLYFTEFVERANLAGLSYLAEAEFAMMLSDNFGKAAAGALAEAPLLRQEQYMDFLRARTFQAKHDDVVTNRLHTAVQLDVVAKWLLPHLDGQRSQADLCSLVQSAVATGQFEVTSNQQPVDSINSKAAEQIVRHALSKLASNALLVE